MNRFAFLIHLMKPDDVGKKFPLIARLPDKAIEWGLARVPPLKISTIRGVRSATGAEVEGWFILLPRTARQILEMPVEEAYDLITRAGKVAEKLGARIFGLGAFTKVIGDKGITIQKRLSIPVTTGNSYTSATAVETALLGAERMGTPAAQARVAVLGATGSIGAACCHMLAGQVKELVLVARNAERLESLAQALRARGGAATQVRVAQDVRSAVSAADIVIAVSSAVDVLVQPEYLKVGAVVCDVARPRNISQEVNKVRPDVLAIDGGVIQIPGNPDFGLNFGMPPGMAEACMAETMILALENRLEAFTLGGNITTEQVLEMAAMARKHGFKVAGFRRLEAAISEAEIEQRRQAAKAVLSGAVSR